MHIAQRPAVPSVTIVVPARNEARNLELVLPLLPAVHEVIVVDGHSSDDTEDVVRRVLPSARFVQQTRRGKGNALVCGFEAATGDVIVMFDADGSADAAEIAAFVATLVSGADFAKGSRTLGDGGSEDITVLRDAGNRALTAVTNRLFGTHYTDLCYGYNAFWRDILPMLALPHADEVGPQWGDGFEIETLINTRVAVAGLQIHEVPSIELERVHGESNLNTFRDGARVLRTIVSERLSGVGVPAPARTGAVAVGARSTRRASQRSRTDPTMPASAPTALVVGPGWRFTSGISYYTCSLTNALAAAMPTDAMLMRQLIPTFLYPGRKRVGTKVNSVDYAEDVTVYDGVDWSWGASMRDASRFLDERRPQVVVLQWWTGAVLHSYLRLARQARRQGAKVVMEWHEVQDSGEIRVPGVQRYVAMLMGRLLSRVDAHVVHSTFDLDLLVGAYDLVGSGAPVSVIPHGPYDYVLDGPTVDGTAIDTATGTGTGTDGSAGVTVAPPGRFNLLFFGVIRPYKGLEDLVEAFGALSDEVRAKLHLTIVGETWEGWNEPLEAVASSPAREQITVVNRYVTDREAQQHFAAADAVVLPYRRSSSSGPLHMAMSAGLPVVVTSVGGLVEAASSYEGVHFVPAADVPALTRVLTQLPEHGSRRYADIRSWDDTVSSYRDVFARVGVDVGTPAGTPTDVGALATVSSLSPARTSL